MCFGACVLGVGPRHASVLKQRKVYAHTFLTDKLKQILIDSISVDRHVKKYITNSLANMKNWIELSFLEGSAYSLKHPFVEGR